MAGLPRLLSFARQFSDGQQDDITLRAVTEIPDQYQSVFSAHPYFNILQSMVFDSVFNTDESLVVSAPTGAGKTGVFELAVVKMLLNRGQSHPNSHTTKAVYLAPIKALCDERHMDWIARFGPVGCVVRKFTGDTEGYGLDEMQNAGEIL